MNADGIIGANGGLQGYNLFAYCNNNPVNMVDSSGWIAMSPFLTYTPIIPAPDLPPRVVNPEVTQRIWDEAYPYVKFASDFVVERVKEEWKEKTEQVAKSGAWNWTKQALKDTWNFIKDTGDGIYEECFFTPDKTIETLEDASRMFQLGSMYVTQANPFLGLAFGTVGYLLDTIADGIDDRYEDEDEW